MCFFLVPFRIQTVSSRNDQPVATSIVQTSVRWTCLVLGWFPAVTFKQKQILNHPTIPLWGFIFEGVTCFNFVVISDLTNMTLWTSGGCLQLWDTFPYKYGIIWISVQTSVVIKWLQRSPTTSFLEARRPGVTQNPMKPRQFLDVWCWPPHRDNLKCKSLR